MARELGLGIVLPDHPVGSQWLWKASSPEEQDLVMTVVRVTKRTVKMEAPAGWTVVFMEKHKALRSPTLLRID